MPRQTTIENRQSGFTLIELLVVIAIIAILAAILFPVFAQAKAAAKKIVSISNAKQLTLACMMYNTDFDGTEVIALSQDISNPPAWVGNVGFCPWTWLILPYVKTADLLRDPQGPPIAPFPGPGWNDTTVKALAPEYGINATYLSPLIATAGEQHLAPISETAIANSSETVFMTAIFGNSETNLAPNSFYWFGSGSCPTDLLVTPPDCTTVSDPMVWCYRGWGTGGLYDGIYLKGNEIAGSRTGGMSLRSAGMAVVTWADGHATAKPAGYMAQGTNWSRTSVWGTVLINDKSKYLWDTE